MKILYLAFNSAICIFNKIVLLLYTPPFQFVYSLFFFFFQCRSAKKEKSRPFIYNCLCSLQYKRAQFDQVNAILDSNSEQAWGETQTRPTRSPAHTDASTRKTASIYFLTLFIFPFKFIPASYSFSFASYEFVFPQDSNNSIQSQSPVQGLPS